MEKAIRRYWPIFVLPTFLAFILGFIAPFAMGVYLSFCKFTTVTDAKFIGCFVEIIVPNIVVGVVVIIEIIRVLL